MVHFGFDKIDDLLGSFRVRIEQRSAVLKDLKTRNLQTPMLGGTLKLGLNRIKNYFLSLYNDYRIVAVDTALELQQKPLKGVIYGTIFTAMVVAYKTRPNENHFLSTISDCRLRLLQVADEVRNEKSEAFINDVTKLVNRNALLSLNLLFLTIVFQTQMAKGCDLYEVRRNVSLLPAWLAAYGRVLDIGAFDHWFRLSREMRNYDVPAEQTLLV